MSGRNTSESEAVRSEGEHSSILKRKGKAKAKPIPVQDHGDIRTVWIWVHPAVHHEVTYQLRVSIAFALEAINDGETAEEPSATVEITD